MQIIKVNSWPRRQFENNFLQQYKFNNFDQLKNLSNWIGRSSNTVNQSSFVSFSYPVNYTDVNYMLIPLGVMDELIIKMFKVYRNFYSDNQLWFDSINPYRDEQFLLFDKDPVFAQRVIIPNPNSQIFFIGDVHSSLHSLIDILINLQEKNIFKNLNSFELNQHCYIFFLGDLVDRGPYSVEVISLAFILKLENPNNVFIINGNHEDRPTYSSSYISSSGFSEEIKYQFNESQNSKYEKLHKLMYALPSVIYLEFAGKLYHLSHGAIPIEQHEIKLIGNFLLSNSKLLLIKEEDHLHSLKWGDFKVENGMSRSNYGRDQFGSDIISNYVRFLNIECLITGHQDLEPIMILPVECISFDRFTSENSDYINVSDRFTSEFRGGQPYEIKSEISINGNIFRHCNHPGISCVTIYYKNYNIPVKYDLYKRYKRNGENETFEFEPRNILALTTSTATIAKDIPFNTYLELKIN